MPRGNGTGPMGMGPMTGRGAGYCAGFGTPGFMNSGTGFVSGGFGCGKGFLGRGGGCGRRNMFYATGLPGWARNANVSPNSHENEKSALANYAKKLEESLARIKEKISQIERDEK